MAKLELAALVSLSAGPLGLSGEQIINKGGQAVQQKFLVIQI
jgi:hypothetical protein